MKLKFTHKVHSESYVAPRHISLAALGVTGVSKSASMRSNLSTHILMLSVGCIVKCTKPSSCSNVHLNAHPIESYVTWMDTAGTWICV